MASNIGDVLEDLLNPKQTSRLKVLSSGNLTADGSEQTLEETSSRGKLSGYVDLDEMGVNDSVTIRYYVKALTGQPYKKYHEETFTDQQINQILYMLPKENVTSLKITLQQTQGLYRRYRHTFILET